jgi:hypothetical protein
MYKWKDVRREEIYLVLGLIILMRITKKPTAKTNFTSDLFPENSVLLQLRVCPRIRLTLLYNLCTLRIIIQKGVPGGMCHTSGMCSLCKSMPI